MICILDRVISDQEKPPIEGARPHTIQHIIQLPFATLEEVAKTYFTRFDHEDSLQSATTMWYEKGTNHRVENGKLTRDMSEISVWAIEITTIEQVEVFARNTVIIRPSGWNHNYLGITIGS